MDGEWRKVGYSTASRRSRRCACINPSSKRIETVINLLLPLKIELPLSSQNSQETVFRYRILDRLYIYCRITLQLSMPSNATEIDSCRAVSEPGLKVYASLRLSSILFQPLNLEILQVFRCFSCSPANRGYLGLWCLLYLALNLLRGRVFCQLL